VLDDILVRLAQARENEEDIRRKVGAAMAYPTLVVLVGVATVFIMLTFFLPRIAELFQRMEQTLPLPTRILLGLSDFLSRRWFWIVAPVVLVLAVLRRVTAGGAGRLLRDRVKLSLPGLRRFILQADIARFTRTFGVLLESGIPIDRALDLSGGALENEVLRREIVRLREETVERGASFSEGLKRAPHFPPFVANAAAVGEEGGRLAEALREVAEFYAGEVERGTRTVTTLIEPLLILVVGGVVGFIVFAMLLPIFEIGQSV
jgi:type II secretory pathway component PulF